MKGFCIKTADELTIRFALNSKIKSQKSKKCF